MRSLKRVAADLAGTMMMVLAVFMFGWFAMATKAEGQSPSAPVFDVPPMLAREPVCPACQCPPPGFILVPLPPLQDAAQRVRAPAAQPEAAREAYEALERAERVLGRE